MKLRLTVTIEVDEVEWANIFGCDEDRVAHDVTSYVRTTLQSSSLEEAGAKVTVKLAAS